jgi:hypothetical protein
MPTHTRRLKSVAEKGDFFAQHRNNIKPVRVLPKVVIGDEFLRRPAQDLLLLPVYKFPWFAKLWRAAHLYFYEYQRVLLEGDNVQFSESRAIAPRQNIKALPQEISACDPFSSAASQQMLCLHTLNVFRRRNLFHRFYKILFQRTPSRVSSN